MLAKFMLNVFNQKVHLNIIHSLFNSVYVIWDDVANIFINLLERTCVKIRGLRKGVLLKVRFRSYGAPKRN